MSDHVTIPDVTSGLRWLSTKLKYGNPNKFDSPDEVASYYRYLCIMTKDECRFFFKWISEHRKAFPTPDEMRDLVSGHNDEDIDEVLDEFFTYLAHRCQNKIERSSFYEDIFSACGFDWQKVRYANGHLEHIEMNKKGLIRRKIREVKTGEYQRQKDLLSAGKTYLLPGASEDTMPDDVKRWVSPSGEELFIYPQRMGSIKMQNPVTETKKTSGFAQRYFDAIEKENE